MQVYKLAYQILYSLTHCKFHYLEYCVHSCEDHFEANCCFSTSTIPHIHSISHFSLTDVSFFLVHLNNILDSIPAWRVTQRPRLIIKLKS